MPILRGVLGWTAQTAAIPPSHPPSGDGLRKKPYPQSLRPKGKAKSGGQVGHKGVTLKQIEAPHPIVKHVPAACETCHKSLARTVAITRLKRQVFDIPVPQIEVTEHQAEVKICACCRHRNVGIFPTEVRSPVPYGPCVQALAGSMFCATPAPLFTVCRRNAVPCGKG